MFDNAVKHVVLYSRGVRARVKAAFRNLHCKAGICESLQNKRERALGVECVPTAFLFSERTGNPFTSFAKIS